MSSLRVGLSVARLAVLAIATLASVQRVAAQGQVGAECRSVPSKILGHPVRYCAFLPPGYDSKETELYPVLYFLHGLGGNEQLLLRSGGMNMLQDLHDQKKIGNFLVIAPDGGRSFYINSHDGKVKYEDFFIREFIPYIESHYKVRTGRRNRGITGVSMGGYGALRFGMKYPQMFDSVSAHSAALIEKLPDIVVPEQQSGEWAATMGGTFGDPIDRGFWQKESPFTIVRNSPRPEGLKIYFDCGTDDDFGFYKGAQQFHDLLTAKKIPHEFHLYLGGHDWSYFAAHLPASLEFHSEAFADAAAK
jgi:S-formylglutathione hydrolase FrmB